MKQIFIELRNQEFEEKFQMLHEPTKINMGSCNNCQGSCFCKDKRSQKVNLQDLL